MRRHAQGGGLRGPFSAEAIWAAFVRRNHGINHSCAQWVHRGCWLSEGMAGPRCWRFPSLFLVGFAPKPLEKMFNTQNVIAESVQQADNGCSRQTRG